jgi:hypothetical protein
MRALLAGIVAGIGLSMRGGLDLLLDPGRPRQRTVQQRAVTRPVVDGLKVASDVTPRATFDAGRGADLNPLTLFAINSLAEFGDVASWEATLEDIVDADEALAEYLDVDGRHHREAAEVARLEAIPVLDEEPGR